MSAVVLLSSCASTDENTSDQFNLESPRYGHAAVNDGEKIYVIAGSNHAGTKSDIEIIDPKSNQITVLSNKLLKRLYFSAVWDGKDSIYILGGMSKSKRGFSLENRVEVFNTKTHEVTFATPLPAPTRINTAVFYENHIFVMGGTAFKNKQLKPRGLLAIYDIVEKKWKRGQNMPKAKATKAVERNGLIYTVAGYDRVTSLTGFDQYNPKTNQWKKMPSLPVGISAHSVTLHKDKLYAFGDYTNLKSTYRFDFNTQSWEKLELGYLASRHNAATSLNDTIYVIGGNTGSNGPFLDYIQTFDIE